MKKLFKLFLFCCSTISCWGLGAGHGSTICRETNTNQNPCYALINYDSTNSGNFQAWVDPIGDGPFTYLWNTGETTQSIIVSTPGINYCVTITSASGCTADNCLYGQECYLDVYAVAEDGLISSSGGIFPISFIWSTGETSHNILPTAPGNYCVTLTDAVGCTKSKCVFWPPCSASISIDSSSQAVTATVAATGTGPFTYLWNTGETTETISGDSLLYNNLCVIVTDANGCVAGDCNWIVDCQSYIYVNYTTHEMTAQGYGASPMTYLWSTGSTDQSLVPTAAGEYCVTITDFLGCESTSCFAVGENCSVQVWSSQDSTQTPPPNIWMINAHVQGFAPYSYQWSYQGATTPSIQVTENAQYCVTITDAFGCEATDCDFAIPCYVGIFIENTQGNEWEITAQHAGTAPFSYNWSTGETTQEITVLQNGYYCVTATDASGCSATNCYYLQTCFAYITADPASSPPMLSVETNLISPNYEWNTGENTATIQPTNSGTYCVTVTGNGCSSDACYYYFMPDNYQVFGYVSLEDSTLALPYEGIAELYAYDAANDIWNLVETVPLNNDSMTWAAEYDFGTWPAGQYIVKATLDPASPYSATYFPTYGYDHLLWNEADITTLPNYWWYNPNIVMQDGINLTNGSGSISGTVTEGDGFTANDEGERSGVPRPNTTVLLYDQNEQPIKYAITDDNGLYRLGELPMGNYKVQVEIVGETQAERWVSLSNTNPNSIGNDFELTPDGIVLGINELIENIGLHISPNPVAGELNLRFDSPSGFEASIKVSRMDGTTVYVLNQPIHEGGHQIKLDVQNLRTGLYFVELASGNGVLSAKFFKE